MRRIIALLLVVLSLTTVSAQLSHVVNIDEATVAAMTAAYDIEAETERRTATHIDSILAHYSRASLSTAGIYLSKLKDRNAMREVGVFGSDENYYYRRILYLVKDGIMPKLIVVASKMVKQPDNAMYWGPYLFKTTQNVEQLCKQFELVVTNGKLSFKDVTFLVINEKLRKLFDLEQFANVDWKALLEKIGDFDINVAKEDIKNDIGRIGAVLASAGKSTVDGNMRDFSAIGRIFKSSPDEIYQLYEKFKSRYESIRNASNVKDILMGVLQTDDVSAVTRLFQIDDYSISGYISNYIKEMQGQYYKQRWYIYSEDSGQKLLASYQPSHPSNTNNADRWDNWLYKENYKEKGTPDYPTLTTSEYNQLRAAAENATGWNSTRKYEYERNHPGHTITLKYETVSYTRSRDKKGGVFSHSKHWRGKHFTVYMTVTDTWSTRQEIYEETFDSESMDETTFKKRMNSKLGYYNSLESDKNTSERVVYKLGSDSPQYYTMADENKMKGCNSVTFLARCDDGANLAEGSFNWKENGKQGNWLEDPKSKEFAMGGTPSDNTAANELQQKKEEYQNTARSLEEQIRSVDKKRSALVGQISQAKMARDEKKVSDLRSQYDTLTTEQEALTRQLSQARSTLSQIDTAISEYYKDLNEDMGSSNRISTNMTELEGLFKLTWHDAGEWVNGADQYTFVRHAYCAQAKSEVTYTAVLKLQSKPRYFLGIRIHRAILSVDYKLSAAYSSENVIETMRLDMGKSEKERAALVNARQKELMEDMPSCTISVKYDYAKNISEEEDPDAIHLLWASDRLDVARDVEFQLSTIYSQLVLLEKVMNDRQTIKDFLTNYVVNPVTRQSRGIIAEYSLQRWMDAGESARFSSSIMVTQPKKHTFWNTSEPTSWD